MRRTGVCDDHDGARGASRGGVRVRHARPEYPLVGYGGGAEVVDRTGGRTGGHAAARGGEGIPLPVLSHVTGSRRRSETRSRCKFAVRLRSLVLGGTTSLRLRR